MKMMLFTKRNVLLCIIMALALGTFTNNALSIGPSCSPCDTWQYYWCTGDMKCMGCTNCSCNRCTSGGCETICNYTQCEYCRPGSGCEACGGCGGDYCAEAGKTCCGGLCCPRPGDVCHGVDALGQPRCCREGWSFCEGAGCYDPSDCEQTCINGEILPCGGDTTKCCVNGTCVPKCENTGQCDYGELPDADYTPCRNPDPSSLGQCPEGVEGALCNHRVINYGNDAKCASCAPNCPKERVDDCAEITPISCYEDCCIMVCVCICTQGGMPWYQGDHYICDE